MRRIALITCLCICTSFAFGQDKSTEVQVFQSPDSSTSLPGITVYLKENPMTGSQSNAKGIVELKGLPKAKNTLVVSAIGYETQEITLSKTDLGNVIKVYLTERVMDLPAFVVSGSSLTGGLTGISSLTGSANYISPREIEKFSYTDINRTLRSVPGVNLQEEDGFGLRPNIGLRGTGVERSAKITVMEDGILMAPAPYVAPAAYYFPTIGRMQGVEILKGSSQIKYGPYTTGGAINLISSQIPDKLSARVHLSGGSFGSRNLHARVGNAHKNFAYMAETFQYASDGFKRLENYAPTGFKKEDYLVKLRFNTSADKKVYQALSLKLGYSVEESNETYLGLNQEDFNSDPYMGYSASQNDLMSTEQSQISLQHTLSVRNKFSLITSVYRNDFSRNWYKLDKLIDSSGTKFSISSLLNNPLDETSTTPYLILRGMSSDQHQLVMKANNRSYYAQGVQTKASFKWNMGSIRNQTDIGLRVHQDQIDRFQWVDNYLMNEGVMQLRESGVPGTESNRIEEANAVAAYVQHELRYGKLTATPGLRYENIQLSRDDYGKADIERTGVNLKSRMNNVDVFIPGIGVNYLLTPGLNLFGGLHKGFAPPGNTEGTMPEESINYEAGARFRNSSWNWQAVLFLNDYENLLGSDLVAAGGAGTTELFNGGSARSQGLEFQMSYNVLHKRSNRWALPLSIVYTYTNAWFTNDFDSNFEAWGEVEDGFELPYLANNQLTLMASLESSRLSFNISGRYMDAMRTVAGTGAVDPLNSTDSYIVLDASANYFLQNNISLFANFTNISNEVYAVSQRPAGLRPGMPRAFMLGLKANF